MVRRDGAEIRKQRIQEVAGFVMRSLSECPTQSISYLMPQLEFQTGLTKEKITEYLVICAGAGRFDIDVEADVVRRPVIREASVEQVLEAARGSER